MKNRRFRRPRKNHKDDRSQFFAEKEGPQVDQQPQADFFQPKLEIDAANSSLEREADAAADQVVNRPQNQSDSSQAVRRKKIQRQGEEEEPAMKRVQRQSEEEEPAAKRIQTQEEEEPAARRIQRQGEEEEPAAKLIQRQSLPEDEIQRQDDPESPEGNKQKAARVATIHSKSTLEEKIKRTKGEGRPLPKKIRILMEKEFGADFSKVRIHTGPQAIEMARSIQAHAFTYGYDIYFNEGRFVPDRKSGRELLAHELAHVVQQKGTGL